MRLLFLVLLLACGSLSHPGAGLEEIDLDLEDETRVFLSREKRQR